MGGIYQLCTIIPICSYYNTQINKIGRCWVRKREREGEDKGDERGMLIKIGCKSEIKFILFYQKYWVPLSLTV